MLADWPRRKRLVLVLSSVLCAGLSPVFSERAWADDEEEDEDEDEDEEEEDEEEEEEDEDQPPVTAGGLFTKESYPISEILRPLTITKQMVELRVGIDIDVSAKTAFDKFGVGLDGRYGLEDNVELQLHFRSDINKFSKLDFGAAVEASIVYDVVDFRLGIAVPVAKDAAGKNTTLLDFELGFPFRYAPKPQVGIIALDTFMTINTKGKPDLTPSVGIIVQPVEMLALKLNAKVIIVDFNTDAGNFQIPVSLNIQFSPSNVIDIGGEFTFPNLKPAGVDPDGAGPMPVGPAPKFYDNRMLLLYGQIRI